MKNISFIIPIFNGEKYIERCLASLIESNQKNIEIILINDGSVDSSQQICLKYTQQYSFITLVNNKTNMGVSYSRNIGIDLATGKYLFFLDVDDYLNYDAIFNLLKLSELNYDLICFSVLSSKQQNLIKNPLPILGEKRQKDLFTKDLSHFFDVSISTWIKNKLYKTSKIKCHSIRFNENMSYSEDLVFNLAYFTCAQSYLFKDIPIIIYDRNVENSLSRQHEHCLISQFFIQRKQFSKFLEENNIKKDKYYYIDCVGLLTYCVFKVLRSNSSRENKIKELNLLLSENIKHLIPYFNLKNMEENKIYNFIQSNDFKIFVED